MIGPKPRGHWTQAALRKDYAHLVRGKRYRVIAAFLDNEKQVHRAGESWVFLDHDVSGPGETVALIVSFDGTQEWCIGLHIDEAHEVIANVQE